MKTKEETLAKYVEMDGERYEQYNLGKLIVEETAWCDALVWVIQKETGEVKTETAIKEQHRVFCQIMRDIGIYSPNFSCCKYELAFVKALDWVLGIYQENAE